MKKFLFFLTFCFLLTFVFVTTTSAQTPSPSSTDNSTSNSTDEAVQQNLKDRLKKVIEEKSDRIKGITDGAPKRGFIGVVKRISEEALTLDTPRGPVVLTIESGIEFWQDKKTIARTDIEIGNEVVVIGVQDNDEFTPERIYLSKTTLRPAPRTIELGSIKKIDKTSITFTSRAGDEKVFSINTKTRYTNAEGETIKSTDFKADQDVLLIAVPEDANAKSVKDSSGRVSLLRALADDK